MAYQNWFNQAANTSAVSSNVPPALVPSQSSVLDTQPVPSSYTTNRQAGSNISTMPQINQIMGVSTGGINTSMFPGAPNSGGSGTGGGNAPSSWSGYSSGGSTGPSTPGVGTNNPGVTQTYAGQNENTSIPYSADPTYSTPYFGGSTTTNPSWGAPTQEDYGNVLNNVMSNFSMLFPGGSAGGYQGNEGLGYTSLADSQAATDYENISNVIGWATNPLGSLFNRN